MGIQPIAVPPGLAYVLSNAGDKSGVDFHYLLDTAIRESRLDPDASNPTSSAEGLFQFLDSTWLQVMKEEGPRLGYQRYADAIVTGPDGTLDINDPKLKAKVLGLRDDPQVAADLAAAFTRDNGEYLFEAFGRMPSPGELYIAHFLGARGAERLFRAGLSNPNQPAAALFPRQAQANRRIFYDSTGHARTIHEVYEALVGPQRAMSAATAHAGFSAQQLAASPTLHDQPPMPGVPPGGDVPLPSRFSTSDMSFTNLFSTESHGASGSPLQPPQAPDGPLFADIYGPAR